MGDRIWRCEVVNVDVVSSLWLGAWGVKVSFYCSVTQCDFDTS